MQAYEGYTEKGLVYPTMPLVGIQGRRRVIITVLDESVREKPDNPKTPRSKMKGYLKGKVWMADDFNAPMEEFEEYM